MSSLCDFILTLTAKKFVIIEWLLKMLISGRTLIIRIKQIPDLSFLLAIFQSSLSLFDHIFI